VGLRSNEEKRKEVHGILENVIKNIETGKGAKEFAENLRCNIENAKKELEESISGCYNKLQAKIADNTADPQWKDEEVPNHDAETMIEKISALLKNEYEQLSVDINIQLNDKLTKQAKSFLEKYKEKIRGFIDESASPEVGDAAFNLTKVELSGDPKELLEGFARKMKFGERVGHGFDVAGDVFDETADMLKDAPLPGKIFGHIALSPVYALELIFGPAITGIFGSKKLVNMREINETVLGPQLLKTQKETDDFKSKVCDKMNELRDYFIFEFKRIDDKLKDKLKEKGDILATQESIDKDIEKNKERIEWLDSIKKRFDSVLAI
jgi:hypothetical protein